LTTAAPPSSVMNSRRFVVGTISHRAARRRRTAEQRDKLAPLHPITSSARANAVSGFCVNIDLN